jgi:hypothetical protein
MQFIPRMKLEKIQMVNKQFNNQIKGAVESRFSGTPREGERKNWPKFEIKSNFF